MPQNVNSHYLSEIKRGFCFLLSTFQNCLIFFFKIINTYFHTWKTQQNYSKGEKDHNVGLEVISPRGVSGIPVSLGREQIHPRAVLGGICQKSVFSISGVLNQFLKAGLSPHLSLLAHLFRFHSQWAEWLE